MSKNTKSSKPIRVPMKPTNEGATEAGRAAIRARHQRRDEAERNRVWSSIRALRKKEGRDLKTGE